MQQLFIGNCEQFYAVNWAKKSNIPYLLANFAQYPCGEQYLQFPIDSCEILPKVTIVHSFIGRNSDNFIQLALINDFLRNNGAQEITLLIPYLAYARQDKITAGTKAGLGGRAVLNLLAAMNFSRVAVFEHHNVNFLQQHLTNAENISASPLIAEQIAKWHNTKSEDLLLIAPDAGGARRVEEIARLLTCSAVNFTKHRSPLPKENTAITGVNVQIPERALETLKQKTYTAKKHGRSLRCIFIDDIIDSGKTLELAIALLNNAIPELRIGAYVTHLVSSDNTIEALVSRHPEEFSWNFSNSTNASKIEHCRQVEAQLDPGMQPRTQQNRIRHFDMLDFALNRFFAL